MSVYHAILTGFGPENLLFLWDELPALEQEEFDAARNLLFLGLKDPAAREDIFSRISAVPDERIRISMFRGSGAWLAGQGAARRGKAGLGAVRLGRQGLVRFGVVRNGTARHGWLGRARRGPVGYGWARLGRRG